MSSPHSSAPPPYSATSEDNDNIANAKPASQYHHNQQPILNPNATTYHLSSYISSIPSRVRDSNNARADRQAAADSALLENVLVPHVEEFLAEICVLPEHPPSATLVLYPAAAMLDAAGGSGPDPGKTPKLSGLDDMQRHGEFVRVQGVEGILQCMDDKGIDSKQAYQGTRSESQDRLWWRDELMAKRLAAYIQPKPAEDPGTPPPAFFDADVARHEQQQREQTSKKKSWALKKFLGGGSSRPPGSPSSPPASSTKQSATRGGMQGRGYAVQSVNASELDTRAKMTVKAEEMTFRVENDMGLYESFNGWALVARVDFVTR